MKKIIVVGATGKLGSVVVEGLKDYEVIRAGRSGPDLKIDALDFASVSDAFASIGSFDGLVSCAGVRAPFKPFEELTICLLYTSPSPRDKRQSRMPSSA